MFGEELDIDPHQKAKDLPTHYTGKGSQRWWGIPIIEYIDLEDDHDGVGKNFMEVFDPFFYRSWECRIPVESSKKATAYNKDYEAEHGTANDGMEVVEEYQLLALDESIWDHIPENEEVGEKEHA